VQRTLHLNVAPCHPVLGCQTLVCVIVASKKEVVFCHERPSCWVRSGSRCDGLQLVPYSLQAKNSVSTANADANGSWNDVLIMFCVKWSRFYWVYFNVKDNSENQGGKCSQDRFCRNQRDLEINVWRVSIICIQ
jgi:hypothetical protein